MDTFSIVVPVYNEARRLPILFAALSAEADLHARSAGLQLVEVIAVDDGSTDETPELVETRADGDDRLRLIRLERNRGKGAAVRRGVLDSTATYVLVTDVDLSTPLSDLGALVAALREGNDLALGSRALASSNVAVRQRLHREVMGKSFNALLRLATGLPYRDTQCGFKLFRLETTRVLFEVQQIDGFAFDAELCLNARRLGLRVAEVPVTWLDNRDTKVKLVRSSSQMVCDLVRLGRIARQPLPRPPTTVDMTRPAEVQLGEPAQGKPD